MCLSTVYRGKEKKEALAKLPESGYYWKCVTSRGWGYIAPCYGTRYKSGWNYVEAKRGGQEEYPVAFHLFRTKAGLIAWLRWVGRDKKDKIVRCKVEKKDIVAIGKQSSDLCIVTTRFWCPKPRRNK